MNWTDYKFRCSRLGDLMAEARAKKDPLSQTTITYLNEIFITEHTGREKDIMNKYMMKGLIVEEDSISLLTAVTNRFYVKNQKKYENEYVKGTPDIVEDRVVDIKSSWDIWTFGKAEVNKDYYWQLQGYMYLTGLRKASLIFCLVDAPEQLISDELRKLSWKMFMIDPIDPLYVEAEEKLRKNLTFGDIDPQYRIKIFEIDYNEEDIEKLKVRIGECREYLANKTGI